MMFRDGRRDCRVAGSNHESTIKFGKEAGCWGCAGFTALSATPHEQSGSQRLGMTRRRAQWDTRKPPKHSDSRDAKSTTNRPAAPNTPTRPPAQPTNPRYKMAGDAPVQSVQCFGKKKTGMLLQNSRKKRMAGWEDCGCCVVESFWGGRQRSKKPKPRTRHREISGGHQEGEGRGGGGESDETCKVQKC